MNTAEKSQRAANAADEMMKAMNVTPEKFLSATNRILMGIGLRRGRIPCLKACRQAWQRYDTIRSLDAGSSVGDWWDVVNDAYDRADRQIYHEIMAAFLRQEHEYALEQILDDQGVEVV